MGESMPLFPNDAPENREQNRRIEITLLKPLAG
jgi:flagellar motor protein MotB